MHVRCPVFKDRERSGRRYSPSTTNKPPEYPALASNTTSTSAERRSTWYRGLRRPPRRTPPRRPAPGPASESSGRNAPAPTTMPLCPLASPCDPPVSGRCWEPVPSPSPARHAHHAGRSPQHARGRSPPPEPLPRDGRRHRLVAAGRERGGHGPAPAQSQRRRPSDSVPRRTHGRPSASAPAAGGPRSRTAVAPPHRPAGPDDREQSDRREGRWHRCGIPASMTVTHGRRSRDPSSAAPPDPPRAA